MSMDAQKTKSGKYNRSALSIDLMKSEGFGGFDFLWRIKLLFGSKQWISVPLKLTHHFVD